MTLRNRLRRVAGTSLVEVAVCIGAVTVSIGGLGMSVISSQNASLEMRERDMVRAQALKILERLVALPFGQTADTVVAANDLRIPQLFDDDPSTLNPSGLTLMRLRTPLNGAGWRFQVGGFEPGGVFEVEVNNDLDGNGVNTGRRGTQNPTAGDTTVAGNGTNVVTLLSENRTDLYRIEVFWNGASLAKSFRGPDN